MLCNAIPKRSVFMPHLKKKWKTEKAPDAAGKFLKCMRIHAAPDFKTGKGDTGDKIARERRVTRITRVTRVTRITRVTMTMAKDTNVTMAIAMSVVVAMANARLVLLSIPLALRTQTQMATDMFSPYGNGYILLQHGMKPKWRRTS